MNFELKNINVKKIVSLLKQKRNHPVFIQYADFNVLNYLYESELNPENIETLYLYPDSTVVSFYIKAVVNKNFKKIISTDLQNKLLDELNNMSSTVFLFGDDNKTLEATINSIRQKYSKIKIEGYSNGYDYNIKKVISEINNAKPDILFVGLGVSRQEKWISENYSKLNVKIIMSVGGWFQYLSGNKKRAPLFLRKNHLEWLHKLFKEFPRVAKRYFIGVPKFLYRVFTKKIIIRYKQT